MKDSVWASLDTAAGVLSVNVPRGAERRVLRNTGAGTVAFVEPWSTESTTLSRADEALERILWRRVGTWERKPESTTFECAVEIVMRDESSWDKVESRLTSVQVSLMRLQRQVEDVDSQIDSLVDQMSSMVSALGSIQAFLARPAEPETLSD